MVGAVVTEEQVRAALNRIVDPCSASMGDDLSLVELGMIYEIRIDGGTVTVDLLFDDPMCLYLEPIHRAIRARVGAVPGVTSVVLDQSEQELWTEDRMQPRARERLHEARRKRRQALLGPVSLTLGGPPPRPTG